MNYLHYTTLQTAPYNREDPLKPLKDIYGSIDNLIEHGFDDALKEAMRVEFVAGKTSDRTNVLKYFAMLCEIIPSCSFEHMLDEALSYKQNLKLQIQASIIEKLISKVLKYILEIFPRIYHNFYENEDLPLILSVILSAICNASETTIVNNFDEVNNCVFIHFWNQHTYKYAGHKIKCSDVILNILIAIVERFPASICKDLLYPEFILHLRLFLTRTSYGNCTLRKKLKAWYDEHNVDEVLENKTSSWKPLLEASQKFLDPDITEALTVLREWIDLRELIDFNTCTVTFLIMSNNILSLLKEILTSSDGSEKNIKTFLTIFLEFKTQPGYQYTWNGKSYLKLNHLMDTAFYGLTKLLVNNLDIKEFDESETSIINDMFTIFHIMQALYILNESWSHWFDVADAPVISDKIKQMDIGYYRRLKESIKDGNTLLEMVSICPDVMPLSVLSTLFDIFDSESPQITKKLFTITRNHILSDIRNIFESNITDACSKFWGFNFEDEIGRGLGPTKEAYSLLSQKLQNVELNLWDENIVSTCISGDSHTFEVEGLFPKISSENLETFIFIGKLLAKALIDGMLLDIPLSDEFFHRLCKPRPSFLRKKYFDIPKIFPITKQLVRDLIYVKRIKDIIQLEPSYTDSEKRDIIKNLTFEDGGNFDDLCLNFTVPGTNIELRKGGKDVLLSPFNVDEYLKELSDVQCDPSEEIEAARYGFEQLLPGWLKVFTPKCLKSRICGEKLKNWSIKKLKSACYLEGYDLDSEPVEFLFQVIASFDQNEQRMFLSFVTGRTNLPSNGFRIKIKKMDLPNPDERLPNAFTCLNTLFLPSYSSLQVTREKISYAIAEGQTFELA